MPGRYSPVECKPIDGGRLMPDVSSEVAGIFNYSKKRDFRRILDIESRREGHDYFYPNTSIPIGSQPFPATVQDIAATGAWAAVSEDITTHRGWIYRYVPGANELKLRNGTSEYTVETEFVAAADSVTVFSANLIVPKTYQLLQYEPVTLIHETRRPNGQRATIVGTPARLYRYFGLDNGAYYEGTGVSSYFEEPPAPNTPYFDDNPGNWIIIGDGFTANAQRWEAVCINGWSIFNNGVDLPVSYRVEDQAVTPMYELRESGVAAVGTIAEFFGILLLMDISEIMTEKLTELFDPIGIRRSGAMTAQQSGTTAVTTPDDFFAATDVGRTIIFDDGTNDQIFAFVDARNVTVGTARTVPPQRFKLRVKAILFGSSFSGNVSATQASGSQAVSASAPFFNAPMVGNMIRYVNGWHAVITGFTDPQNITVDTPAPEAFTALPFYIVILPENNSVDYQVHAFAPVFTVDMVGRNISWENGEVRRIMSFIDNQNVMVDGDITVQSGLIGIDNPATYSTFSQKQFINRIAYRVIWSMNDLPTRFAPIFYGTITAGTHILQLSSPYLSLAIGDKLIIAGAGIAGGNLTATVLYVAAHQLLFIDTAAVTSMSNGLVQKEDALNSIVGFEDLQDDSSGIIRALELGGYLIIYKDTAIVRGRYTGNIDTPFEFQIKRIPANDALFYRNTLVMVNSEFHLYAARDSFMRLDLVSQYPQIVTEMIPCGRVFFDVARLQNTQFIWAGDNVLTSEIVIGIFPYDQEDRLLCYDYFSRSPTVSTSSARISALATVKRPATGATVGETEDWCVMGTPTGVVLIYGRTFLPNPQWTDAREIIFRRELNPYSVAKTGYTSIIKSGMSHFGNAYSEKDIRAWVLLLGSHSPETQILMELFGKRSVEEVDSLLGSKLISPPETLVPVFFRQNYFGDQITVNGMDNPIEIAGRILDMSGVNSRGFIRRQP